MFKNTFSVYSGLDRNIYALFALQLITATGLFVFPYLALILTAKFGYGAQEAGYWVSAASLSGFFGMLFFGKLSDMFGRKRVLIAALSISITSASLSAILAKSMLLPYIILVTVFCTHGIRPINNAIIADTTPVKDRNRAFALLYLGLNIGAAMGNVIAGYLFNDYLAPLFALGAIAISIAAIIVIKYVRETKPSDDSIVRTGAAHSDEGADRSNILLILFKKPILLAFALIFILYTFTYAQNFFSLPLYMQSLFGEYGSRGYAHQNFLNCLLVILLTTHLTSIIRHNSAIKNIVLSGLLYSVGFGILFLNVPHMWFFYLSTTIWTVGEIICYPGMNAFISSHSPINKRAGLNSAVTSISYIGMWIGSSLSGYLIKSIGAANMWIVVFAVSICATFLMGILFLVDRNRKVRIKSEQPFLSPPLPAQGATPVDVV